MTNNNSPSRATILNIIDAYEGMLSHCNDGEGSEHILEGLAKWEAALAALDAKEAA